MADTTVDKGTSTSEQEYVLAGGKNGATDVPPPNVAVVQGTEYYGAMPPQKQGHKCCGGCCDMRRATMIVNFVNMGLIFLGLWYIVGVVSYKNSEAGQQARAVDDDEVQEMYAEADEIKGIGILVTVMVIRFLCNAAGAYGAYIFNMYMVGLSLASFGLEIIFALLSFNLGGLLIGVFFAYPHVFFIKEVRAGIMTPKNYPVEEQSCCCV